MRQKALLAFAAGTLLGVGLAGSTGRKVMAGQRPAEGKQPPPFWTYEDFKKGSIPQEYTIRKGHPRLLITPDNRGRILARAKAAPKLFQAVIDLAEKGKGEPAALAGAAVYQLGLIDGFKHALSREQYGKKAVEATMALIGDASMEDFETYTGCRLGVPCGYDWLYPLLTAEQKQALVKEMIRLTNQESLDGGRGPASSPEVFCPFGTLSGPHCPFGGHRMTMGLAFYGDGVDDASAKRIVDETFKKLWWNPQQKLSYGSLIHMVRYLEGGGWFGGMTHYGRNAAFFPHIAAWKTATGQDYFARLGYFRNLPYLIAHSNVPKKKGEPNCTLPLFRFYSLNPPGRGADAPGVKKMLAAATGYLARTDPAGASLAQWLLEQDPIGGIENLPDDGKLVFALLMGEPAVQAKSPEQLKLPLTLVVRGMGIVHMRSDWSDPDATLVGFADNRFVAYAAEAANCFGLWKNGAALFPYRGQISGGYEFEPSATPGNDIVGYYNTDGSFWDPGVLKPVFVVPKAGAPPRGRGSATRREGFAIESVPGEFDFMHSTMQTHMYRRYLLRTLLYLRAETRDQPEFVVLRDRTDRYLTSMFQSAAEPKVGPGWDTEGKAVPITGGSWGQPAVRIPGQWTIRDVSCITVTNDKAYERFPGPRKAHGRAFLKVVWPESVKVTKIGGPGHEMDILADRRGAKSGGGALWRDIGVKNPTVNDKLAFGGFWRLIAWPGGATRTRTFLYVIEPTDSKARRPHTICLLKCATAIAAQAGPNVVVFGKDHKPFSSAKVQVAAETARVLVSDVEPGAIHRIAAGKRTVTAKASAAGLLRVKDLRLSAGQTLEVTPAEAGK
jgi:hypothetical protein